MDTPAPLESDRHDRLGLFVFCEYLLRCHLAHDTYLLPILFVIFGIKFFGKRGLFVLLLIGIAVAGLTWITSSNLRDRVTRAVSEVKEYQTNATTSAGVRLQFWRSSIELAAEAPLLGHGTGA